MHLGELGNFSCFLFSHTLVTFFICSFLSNNFSSQVGGQILYSVQNGACLVIVMLPCMFFFKIIGLCPHKSMTAFLICLLPLINTSFNPLTNLSYPLLRCIKMGTNSFLFLNIG